MAEKPLTDSINALTAYINEVTGNEDTTLSDAVGTLIGGYGGISIDNWATGAYPKGNIVINSDRIYVNSFNRRNSITGVFLTNATYIESSAFSTMSNLSDFSAQNLEQCQDSILANNYKLKNVYLPKLYQVGSGTFSMSNIENISLPSLLSVKNNTFRECKLLKTVKLASCTKIEATNAFYNCTALTDIYLPNDASTYTGAPWGAVNATIHYNTQFDENGEPIIE